MPYIKVTLNTDIWNTIQVQRSKMGINFTTDFLFFTMLFFFLSFKRLTPHRLHSFIAPLFVQFFSINFRS